MPISTPTQITVPFATSGLKNAIPAASDPVTGNAGYDQGFTAINMTPRTAGGIPPFGQDFNGIFFDISTALQFLEAGGSFPYSSAFATAVGGYPLGALVSQSNGSGLWRSTVANNTADPEGAGTGWQPEDAGRTAITMTNANVTLTALQAARSIIIITGTLTANLQLIMPTYVKQWLIVNSCTGAFTITVKTASGSGIVIPAATTASVYGDGTNIGSASGIRSVKRQVFTATGTYTPSAGMVYCDVELVGAGGGGGGATGGSGSSSAGGGGGAGAYTRKIFSASDIGASKSVTIGAGGTGATAGNNSGGTGGTTSLGALLTGPGGVGGGGGGSTATQAVSGSGGQGGVPTLGEINTVGSSGFAGLTLGGANGALSGQGGSSMFGVGGYPSGPSGAGISGLGRGSGGSGGASTGTSAIGGPGGPGYVVITEYCTQ